MSKKILLITPPFVQLNTPYPATAYLKGFLNTLGHKSFQSDLGIEVILKIFNKTGLHSLFQSTEKQYNKLSENSKRIFDLSEVYCSTIDPVISFLQHKNPTLALSISDRSFLPEAARFEEAEDLDWAFGTMGIQDKARHFATLYLEDLADFITEAVDEHFGFSRYAERLGRTATHFAPIEAALEKPDSYISKILLALLEEKIQSEQPDLVVVTIPFPGNVFSAFKIGQHLRKNHPTIKIAFGGGYCNTELRSVSDEKVFKYVDFICLDDGELPLKLLLEHLDGKRSAFELKRTFICSGDSASSDGVVSYVNAALEKDIPQRETGTPDYSDLPLSRYLSVIEIVNPMHRLWSDGRWNKLTLAHGCYWGKCTFCDVSLDYIGRYEPINATMLCDRIQEIINQTGETGFHFVDEAAPPALMKDLAIEIIKRNMVISWWTNIRFEKSFTNDLCKLLKASGCIAVSGGLEVASDRLLTLMQKGVSVAQVARVAEAFTASGIMVHAYLMYGFPTQTAKETIDSLENVRQLFEAGVIQSGFWHQFAMTAHSPVGLNPEKFEVRRIGPEFGGFAENDLFHEDPKGAAHETFSEGLKKSLFNYMHGIGLDYPLGDWFEFSVPKTSVKPNFIEKALNDQFEKAINDNQQVLWLSNVPKLVQHKGKKANLNISKLTFTDKKAEYMLLTGSATAEWLDKTLRAIRPQSQTAPLSIAQLKTSFQAAALDDYENFDEFLASYTWKQLREAGLLIV
ncbi:MAG: B12-binding domain-containing radical SAM protein [Saprospiraceae bacterium]